MNRTLAAGMLASILSGFFAGGCEKKCVPSKEVNCRVNSENYEKITIGMPIEKVESMLGQPYIWTYANHFELFPESRRYIWERLMASDARGKQISIIIDTDRGLVKDKKMTTLLLK